jgi:LPXTG-motif cell wall-anchored protein
MKNVKAVLSLLAVTLLGATVLPSAHADTWNKKTVVTFSQDVEVPGKILPAGTYTFQLLDSNSDRHIVQIFNADGTQIIATILAINDYRLQPTGDNVMKFSERPGDSPEALRAWFYPGDNFGQQFVYPKSESERPSRLNHVRLTAAGNMANSAQPTAPSNPTTQSDQGAPVPQDAREPSNSRAQTETSATKELPQTASSLPLIGLVGVLLVGTALILRRIARA